MSGGVRARGTSDGAIGLVLPADWWVVPLADETQRGRVVAALVEHQVGGGDASAALRRQLRVDIGAAARRAAASGGWGMAFMLMRAGDHPLPATMTGYRSPGSFRDEGGVAEVRGALEAATVAAGGRLDAGAGPFGLVLRSIRERTGTWHDVVDLPVLACDYWTDPDDGHGLVHLSFTTSLVALRDAMCDLFDTVVATLHRSDHPPAPDAGASDDDLVAARVAAPTGDPSTRP
ncbi:hypothetical protein [Cellulomonas sp. S1-8]|uniref:hypothetical protein n=1 Tax=Cellulomonas sp. S1-8 TaxID=2904790 RepID=UPI002243E92A|nr:hypothetical protein [Cellulomonas sp. S1-8]UZN04783.1 hypothetical protein OKX07_07745 [Cellulomonas sp. S1-8]